MDRTCADEPLATLAIVARYCVFSSSLVAAVPTAVIVVVTSVTAITVGVGAGGGCPGSDAGDDNTATRTRGASHGDQLQTVLPVS